MSAQPRRGATSRHVNRWSESQDATLKALTAEGQTTAQIGVVMGRTKESVQCRLHVLRNGHSDRQQRPCLCCSQMFLSAWKGNRLCPNCSRQAQSVSPYAP